MHPSNCLNCGQPLSTGQQFCSHCGQKAEIHRFSFHELLHELVHYFTHADKGIFHLLKELATKPGLVASEYLAGARKRYFPPLNFFLIVAGVVVFMGTIFHKQDDSMIEQIRSSASHNPDPVQRQHIFAMAERIGNTNTYTSKYANIITMVATPLITIFFWLFYKRGRYNYTEHLVANMYMVGFLMLLYALVFIPLIKMNSGQFLVFVLLAIFFIFETIYRSIAYYQFMGRKGAGAYIKALSVSLLIAIVWVGGTTLLIRYYVQHGF